MTLETKKARNSNLELYRIIVMLLIVAHHYVVNSGLLDLMKVQPFSPNSIFLYLFGMWGKTSINCFVMITGYFMCTSHITLRKFLKLLFEVLFYIIVINTAFILFGYEKFSFSNIIHAYSIVSFSEDFVSCFMVFYLFIPFLNVLIKKSQSQATFTARLIVLIPIHVLRIDTNFPN